MARGRSYEKCWDMPFGGSAPGHHISKWFVHVAIAVLGTIFRPLFRYQVKGAEKLFTVARETGVVLVANHTSFLDVIFIYMACRPETWPRFMARDTLFDNTPAILGWILAHAGVFPVKRDSADRTSVKRAAKMLKNGELVVILPEGTRRGKGSKPPEVHGGAALIARMGKAPIVPMTVRNAENVKRKGERIRFPKVTAEFGDPILVGDFDFLPKHERLDGCVWYALRECFALSRYQAPEDVDMAGLFPDSADFSEAFAEHPVPHRTAEEVAQAARAKREKAEAREAARAGEGGPQPKAQLDAEADEERS